MSNDPSVLRSVRVHLSAWEMFKENCAAAGTKPNAKLNDFIHGFNQEADEGKHVYLTPKQRAKAQIAKNAFASTITEQIDADKPIGFDAATGEPIFKRGVGPQRGKK